MTDTIAITVLLVSPFALAAEVAAWAWLLGKPLHLKRRPAAAPVPTPEPAS